MKDWTRRDWLKAAGVGAVGMTLPWLREIPRLRKRRSLADIDGSIVGDEVAFAHAWRDGQVSFRVEAPKEFAADIGIVGGGVAGLTSAWCLARAGIKKMRIFERKGAWGGTALAGKAMGRLFPWGAHYVDPPARESKGLLSIYEDLGVVLGLHPKDGRPICDPAYIVKLPHHNVVARGKWSRGIIPRHLATPEDRRCIRAFAKEMERLASLRDREGKRIFGYPLESLSGLEAYRALDRLTMLEYLQKKGWARPLLVWSVNDRCVDEFSVPIDRISAWAGIQYYASVEPLAPLAPPPGMPYEPELDWIEPSDRKMSWPQGNAFLTEGIRSRLPEACQQNHAFVVRLQNVEDGVCITSINPKTRAFRTEKFRAAIFAAPKYLVYPCIPELATQGRREFQALEYVPWIVACLHCRRAPAFSPDLPMAWENFRFRGWSQGFINPQHLEPGGWSVGEPGLLVFYACLSSQPQAERRELLAEGWEFWAQQVLDELERMHPEIPSLVTRVDIFRWGHAMHAPKPGYLFGPERKAMQKPCGRIFFSHSDVAGPAVFEQVTYRGIAVAEQVMDALSHPYVSLR